MKIYKKGFVFGIMTACGLAALVFFCRLGGAGIPASRPEVVPLLIAELEPSAEKPEVADPSEDGVTPELEPSAEKPEIAETPGDGGRPELEPPAEEPEPPESPEAQPGPLMASPHFRMDEYRCDCAGYCDGWPAEMAPELLDKIEALRCYFDRPIIITSGVRCAERNAEVGGIEWSFHKRGRAADLYCPGVGLGDLVAGAQACGLNVLPYYRSGYIHVEVV